MHRYHLAGNGRKHEGVLQAEPVDRIGGQWLLLFPAFMLKRQQLLVPIENGYLRRLVAVLSEKRPGRKDPCDVIVPSLSRTTLSGCVSASNPLARPSL